MDDSLKFDLTYWQESGWLEPRCSFYVPRQASRVKAALARLAGAALAPFVS